MTLSQNIGFIGAGMMAEALAKGFVSKGVIQAGQVYCHDPSAARQEVFRSMGANPCQSGAEVCVCCGAARARRRLGSRHASM